MQHRLIGQRARENENASYVVRKITPNGIYFCPCLDPFDAHALVPAELQEHFRLVFPGCRVHTLDAGQGRERLLDRARNQSLDFFGCRALVGNLDEDSREFDIRKLFEWQKSGGNHPDQRERHEDHGGRYRAAKCDLGVFHVGSRLAADQFAVGGDARRPFLAIEQGIHDRNND